MSWNSTTLGDVLVLQRGHDLPEQNRRPGSVPVMGSAGINGYHDTVKSKGPGVVIGRSGASFGKAHYTACPYWPHNTVLYVKDFKGNHPRFIYYLLDSIDFHSFNSGSAQPSLNRNYLYGMAISFPTVGTQCKIASILSAYDDLIENNRRRIAILEEMARNLYREWFVKFRFPIFRDDGTIERIHDPERDPMQDSPLGLIPEGWEVKTVGDILAYHIGGGWGKECPDDKHIMSGYVIRGTDIPGARVGELSDCPFRYHNESNMKSRELEAGDIVFEVSGGSKGQPVGRSLFVTEEILRRFNDKVMCASFCKLLRVNGSLIRPELMYLYLNEIYGNGEIDQYQVQSTGIINFKFQPFLDGACLSLPPTGLQASFSRTAMACFRNISVFGQQNHVLRKTRDHLLPKLISGQVDVSELDIDVPAEVAG